MFTNADHGSLISNSITWSLLTIGSLLKPMLFYIFALNSVNDLIFTILQDTAFICTIIYSALNIFKFLGYNVDIKKWINKKRNKNRNERT